MSVLAPPTAASDPELDRLVAEHGAEWDITRRTDYRGTPGGWRAVRHDPRPSLQGLGAATAEELRSAIECAEAMRP